LQLNFFAALRATRAAGAQMIDQGEGAIVNVASVNAFFHPDGLVVAYGIAKAALLNLAKARPGAWAEGDPHQQRLPRPRGDRPVAGRARRRGHRRGGDRDERRGGARRGGRRHADGALHDARGSGDARDPARIGEDRNVNGSNYVIDGGLVKTM
jgi:NAD(P)-dependent dehydrogenase (short-subunit alcohol dehydrogenase family)